VTRPRAVLAALAVLVAAPLARADEAALEGAEPAKLPVRTATFAWEKTKEGRVLLRASFAFRDALDAPLLSKLTSGMPQIIALRAYVLREGEAEPVALAVRSCRIVYDLWDEIFRVHVTSAGGERDVAAVNVEGVLRQCAEAKDLLVVDRSLLRAGAAHYLGVLVDVNPVSPQMVAEMRRWVSRPTGSTGIGPSDALFGSFVGLFVRNLGASDRTLRFRTQTFSP
jgi:hypothetical protein